jgi:RNA polymerase sigma-70 factor, ECF subfamily
MRTSAALSYRSTHPPITARTASLKLVEDTLTARVTRLQQMEDEQVITAYLAGSEYAFTELYERYKVRLHRFLYRMVGDRERAEDLVQETFLRVYRHLHRFDRMKKFSTWVYTIASNLAKNELRNRSRDVVSHTFSTLQGEIVEDDMPLQFEDRRTYADDMYHKRHLRELVENTARDLPEHFREVFVLRELEGKTYEEISQIIDCNLGTVKSRLNRARTAFAIKIEPKLD